MKFKSEEKTEKVTLGLIDKILDVTKKSKK